MKFSQYTPVVAPNTIQGTPVQAQNIPVEHPSGARASEAWASAFGQLAAFAQKQQDEKDSADVMSARNEIMTNLTGAMYGEHGLLTTGVGKNAQGLTDRVTQTIQQTFKQVSGKYNRRVQQALQGNLNENMANFQRIAAQQEGREFVKQKDANYGISIENCTNMVMMNYQDENLLDSSLNDIMRIVDYRAKDQGYNELQRQQERKKVITAIVGGAMQASMDNQDFDTASIYADRYGKYMDQAELMKYQKGVRQEKRLVDERNLAGDILARHRRPDGTYDENAIFAEIDRMSQETKTVGGGGINTVDGLLAAIGGQESGGDYNAENGRTGAHGKYQIMPENWPSWADEAGIGSDAPRTPENQELVARYKMTQYLQQYGPEGAMVAWYAGPGNAERWVNGETTDVDGRSWDAKNGNGNEPSIREYVQQVSARGGQGGWNVDSGAGKYVGARMDNGEVGCVEFVTKAGAAGGNQFLQGQLDQGVVNVPQLVANAGNMVIPFEAGKLSKGDLIIYGDDDHVVIYDSGYRYYGNSSGHRDENGNKDPIGVHGQDYRQMDGLEPTKIIKTGGAGGGGRTVNAHDSGWADRMKRLVTAKLADADRTRKADLENRLEGYKEAIQNAGGEGAVQILERIRQNENNPSMYNSALAFARYKYPEVFEKPKGGNGGNGNGGSNGSSKEETSGGNAADVMAAQLGRGASVSSETLVKVRNYNRLNQEEWDYLHSEEIQGQLADLIDSNGGDLQETYNQLAAKYGERAAAQIIATADDGYFEK